MNSDPDSHCNSKNDAPVKPKLHLHIGSPKTGTTSLQYYLYEHRELLSSRGFLYPTGLNLTMAKGHHPLFFAVSDTWWHPDFYYDINAERLDTGSYLKKYAIDDCLRELRYAAANSNNLLISSEGFFDLDSNGVKSLSHLLSGFDVSVYVYLRRQDQFIESMYRHFVMDSGARFNIPIENYLEGEYVKHCDYLSKVDTWAEHFGKEHLTVVPYQPSALKEDDVIIDFLDRVGCDTRDLPESPTVNRSQPNDVLAMLTLSNGSAWEFREDAAEYSQFTRQAFESDGKKSPLLSTSQAIQFLDQYSDDNKALAEKYLPDSDGDFFDNSFPLPSDSTPSRTHTVQREKVVNLLNRSVRLCLESDAAETEDLVLASTALFKASKGSLRREMAKRYFDNHELEVARHAAENAKQHKHELQESHKELQLEIERRELEEKLTRNLIKQGQDENNRLSSEVARLQKEHGELVDQLQAEETRSEEKANECDLAYEKLTIANEKCSRLDEHLSAALSELTKIQSDKTELAKELDPLKAQLKKTEDERSKTQAELLAVQLMLQEAKQQSLATRQLVSETRQELEDAVKESHQITEKLEAALSQKELHQSKMGDLMWLIEQHVQRNAQLTTELEQLRNSQNQAAETISITETGNNEHPTRELRVYRQEVSVGATFWSGIGNGSRYILRQPRKSIRLLVNHSLHSTQFALRHPRKSVVNIIRKPWQVLRYTLRQPKKSVLLTLGLTKEISIDRNKNNEQREQAKAA